MSIQPQSTQGFTLLEAIIALVLIAIAGLTLFSWINTNIISLQRIEAAQTRAAAVRSGLAFIQTVNPLLNESGQQTIGIYTFNWVATPVEAPKDGVEAYYGNMGLYKVGLYDVKVDIYLDKSWLTQFQVRQAGYQQVREPSIL